MIRFRFICLRIGILKQNLKRATLHCISFNTDCYGVLCDVTQERDGEMLAEMQDAASVS